MWMIKKGKEYLMIKKGKEYLIKKGKEYFTNGKFLKLFLGDSN